MLFEVATLETTRVVGGTAYTGEEGFPLCTDAAGCRDACNAITDCGASAALCFAVVPSHGLSICHMCIFKRWTAF